jgi:hypothetical protein
VQAQIAVRPYRLLADNVLSVVLVQLATVSYVAAILLASGREAFSAPSLAPLVEGLNAVVRAGLLVLLAAHYAAPLCAKLRRPADGQGCVARCTACRCCTRL